MSLEANIFRFANFTLDTNERVLLENDRPVPVTPKALQLLCVLVECHGHIVEKEILISAVWPDSFVEESNLTFNIRQLRKILGDQKGHSDFIETVPRRGYRFVAETEEIVGSDEILIGAGKLPQVSDTDGVGARGVLLRQNRSLAALLTVLLAASLVAGFWFLRAANSGSGSVAPILSAPSRSEALSHSDSVFHPRISPDGKHIAYVTHDHGNQTIWLREQSTATNFPLLPPSTDEYGGMMFSSKGDFIYFMRKPWGALQAQGAIYRISVFGGIPTKLLSDLQGWFSVSPVDDRIAFVRFDAERRSLLTIADADGKGERIVATREGPYNFRATRWSSDGKTIVAAVGQSDSGANEFGLSEIDVYSGSEREIVPRKFFYISDLEWLPERSGLLFTARENDSPNNQIWQVSLNSGEPVKIVDDGMSYTSLSLNRDATQMVVSRTIAEFHLTVADFGSPTDSFSTSTSPAVSSFNPSGKIAYTVSRGQHDIWMMNADGTEQRQLTNNPAADFYPLASPDEKHVFFTSTRSGNSQIWRMNADGSDEIQITKNEGGYPLFVSPDGRFLYYLSAFNKNIWRIPLESGDESLFYDRRVLSPAFSPNGKYLAYFYREKEQDGYLRMAVVSTDSLVTVFSFKQMDQADIVQAAWARDSRSVFYASARQSITTLWRQHLSADRLEKVTEIGGSDLVLDFSVSPAGDKFAYVSGVWKHEATLIRGLR